MGHLVPLRDGLPHTYRRIPITEAKQFCSFPFGGKISRAFPTDSKTLFLLPAW